MTQPTPGRDGAGRRIRRQADPPAPRRAPTLFDPPAWSGTSIDAAFLAFHEQHPHVYRRLVQLALDLRARGVQRYGIKALFEIVRYEGTAGRAQGAGDFVLNNNFSSRYARLIEAQEPRLQGFFSMRRLPSRDA